MIVSSVFLWLEQIRYKTEVYEGNTLEQRRLKREECVGETRRAKTRSVGTLRRNGEESVSAERPGSKDQSACLNEAEPSDNNCRTPAIWAGHDDRIVARTGGGEEENDGISQRDKDRPVGDKNTFEALAKQTSAVRFESSAGGRRENADEIEERETAEGIVSDQRETREVDVSDKQNVGGVSTWQEDIGDVNVEVAKRQERAGETVDKTKAIVTSKEKNPDVTVFGEPERFNKTECVPNDSNDTVDETNVILGSKPSDLDPNEFGKNRSSIDKTEHDDVIGATNVALRCKQKYLNSIEFSVGKKQEHFEKTESSGRFDETNAIVNNTQKDQVEFDVFKHQENFNETVDVGRKPEGNFDRFISDADGNGRNEIGTKQNNCNKTDICINIAETTENQKTISKREVYLNVSETFVERIDSNVNRKQGNIPQIKINSREIQENIGGAKKQMNVSVDRCYVMEVIEGDESAKIFKAKNLEKTVEFENIFQKEQRKVGETIISGFENKREIVKMDEKTGKPEVPKRRNVKVNIVGEKADISRINVVKDEGNYSKVAILRKKLEAPEVNVVRIQDQRSKTDVIREKPKISEGSEVKQREVAVTKEEVKMVKEDVTERSTREDEFDASKVKSLVTQCESKGLQKEELFKEQDSSVMFKEEAMIPVITVTSSSKKEPKPLPKTPKPSALSFTNSDLTYKPKRPCENDPPEPLTPNMLRRQVNIDVSKINLSEDDGADAALRSPRSPRRSQKITDPTQITPAPLTKGKSLDSLLDTIGEEEAESRVEMRAKRHSVGAIFEAGARRRAILVPDARRLSCTLETISEDDRHSGSCGRVLEYSHLQIKHGDIARTSVTFEDTVEDIAEGSEVPVRYFAGIPSDLVMWLTDLVHASHGEEDVEMESYTIKDSSHSKEISFPVDKDVSPSNNRKTLGPYSSELKIPSQTFEKVTKISVDGKSYKVGKNDVVKLENNKLFIRDEKGGDKILIPILQKFEKTSKDLVYTTDRGTVKFHKEKDTSLVLEKSTFLQKFLRKRTSREDLEKKGILKNEPIFGNTLDSLAEKFNKDVPEFVVRTTKLIEENNIQSPGIYRASGNVATIQKIRLKVDSNKLNVLDEHKTDSDVLAGALKMFFRELKESLIGRKQYEQFNNIISTNNSTEDYAAVGSVIRTLSRPHRETLEHLMRHLLKVIEHEQDNHMSIQNMSICWGPSIVCFQDSNITKDEMIAEANTKNCIVDLLLRTYKASLETSIRPSGSTFSLQSLASDRFSGPKLQRSMSAEDNFASMGSRSSSCTNLGTTSNWTFVEDLMKLVEGHRDVAQAYTHQGQEKAVTRIRIKSQKFRSKTLPGLLRKADVNTLGCVLKECYVQLCHVIIEPAVFDVLMRTRAEIKKGQVDIDQEVISRRMRGVIVSEMRKLPYYKYHEKLFEHFLRVMSLSPNGVSKQSHVINFWHAAICQNTLSDATVPLIITILDAYDKKRWSTDIEDEIGPATEEDDDVLVMRPNSLYDNVEVRKSLANNGLTKISEENLCDGDDKLCVDLRNCYNARPLTSLYTKAQDDDKV